VRAPERALGHDETGRPDERALLLLPVLRPSTRRVLVQRSQEHRAERSLFADGAAGCGLLHIARDTRSPMMRSCLTPSATW